MSFLNFQSKTNQEGCGKWLTTKKNTNPKGCVKSTKKHNAKRPAKPVPITVPSSILSLDISKTPSSTLSSLTPAKPCHMKQTKINKFVEKKTRQCSSGSANVMQYSQYKAPISRTKREISVIQSEHEELWGSESEDDDLSVTLLEHQPAFEITNRGVSPVIAEVTTESVPVLSNSLLRKNDNVRLGVKRNIGTNNDQENEDIIPLSKKIRKVDDNHNPLAAGGSFSKRNEVQFTQWLHDQIDEFCRHSFEVDNAYLIKGIFSPGPCCNVLSTTNKNSNSPEKSRLLSQFSEWLNQQIKSPSEAPETQWPGKVDKELSQNRKHSPREICKQTYAFTQWYEESMETFLNDQKNKNVK